MRAWCLHPGGSAAISLLWIAAGLLGACGPDGADGAPAAGGSGGEDGTSSGGYAPVGGASAGGATTASGGAFGTSSGGVPGSGGWAGGPATGGSSSGGVGSGGGGGSGGDAGDGCPFAGHVTYQLNGPDGWPDEVVQLITAAMDEALHYYNCYADLTKAISVHYKPSVPTAEANVDGVLSFGTNQGYMQVATAMHEVGHTLGVGYYPWAELANGGRWIGPNVVAFMQALPAEERDPDEYSQRDYITIDSQHFWPYGLNQASEHQSEWSLIDHVRIVAAMQKDKQAYLDGDLP